jgi:hypothetical protein
MPEAEVRLILGPAHRGARPFRDRPTHAELWTAEGEEVRSERFSPPWKVYWLEKGPPPADQAPGRGYEMWAADRTAAYVWFDASGRAREKLWLEERDSPAD